MEEITLRSCPIEGCPKKWRTLSGLEAHLYNDHLKSDLIKCIAKYQRLFSYISLKEGR